ncbi:hypothetical protein ACIQU5_27190 [Streptomyces sp. NPDC090306]|uniref:hypothetical protein n=1 Tax=Streptomyces sp. NPDC090306 TaxID=3365961 RepID=UPI00382939FA
MTHAEGGDSRERHEPYEWHEPTCLFGQDHKPTHAGNGTVNHGPDDDDRKPDERGTGVRDTDELGTGDPESGGPRPGRPKAGDLFAELKAGGPRRGGPKAVGRGSGGPTSGDPESGAPESGDATTDDAKPGRTKSGAATPGAATSGAARVGGLPEAGLGADELDLRRLLHRAVEDVEPRDGALEHLRRAVPARRTRKRQAAVGMAAAALFVGTAVPALLHVSNSVGSTADPSIAGNASQAQGGSGQNAGSDSGRSNSATSSGQASEKGATGVTKDPKDPPSGAGSTTDDGSDPSSAAAGVADCTATQLGSGTTTLGAPDSVGTVYGSFRVTNISTTGCTVTDAGSVTVLAQGAADAAKVGVAQHVAGDPATGLSDTAGAPARLLLLPGAAYEVKFAWVPSETCPTSSGTVGGDDSGTGGASPAPSPSGDDTATTGTSTGGDTGLTEQLMPEDGTADGSVVVSYTPQAGAPAVTVTVPNACAGTVYRAGVASES